VCLKNVLLSPGMRINVISVSQLISDDCEVHFNNSGASVTYQNQEVLQFYLKGGLYHLKFKGPSHRAYFSGVTNKPANMSTYQLWHNRLGHINSTYMDKLCNQSLATGVPKIDTKSGHQGHQCRECCLAKSRKQPTGKIQGDPIVYKSGEYISADLVTMHTRTMDLEKYALTITDEGSGLSWSILLKNKDVASEKIIERIIYIQKQRDLKVLHFKADGGGEFVNEYLQEWLRSQGIEFDFGPPYTPEYNGKNERLHQTLEQMTIAFLQSSNLGDEYWGYAWLHATYIRNRTPHSGNIDFRTPFESFYGYRPDLSHIRIFGCIAYAHIDSTKRKKLHPKSVECVFLGFDDRRRSSKLMPVQGRRTIIYRKDVIFHEGKTISDLGVKPNILPLVTESD